MKVSYRWLRDLTPGLELDAEAVSQRLADRGAPVEEVVHLAKGLDQIVVARVASVERHPGADRLSVCTVDAGGGALLRVVCGAPNVRAGTLYPFAPVGTEIPGGIVIRKAKIRGEVSEGMLCSARELGLGSDHAGILELAEGPEPGTPLVVAMGLDDWRLDVEVTANRGDLLSHVGIAREVAPSGQAGVAPPSIPGASPVTFTLHHDAREAHGEGFSVRVEDGALCPRYLGAVVRGVRVGASPAWLQTRLRAAGARPINNVVDATNYVLLELGQPLHAFDLDKLEGRAIVVRQARADEKSFRTLDGVERRLAPDMLMICDAARPVAVAGVMGGEESEVSEDTRNILLECALFDPKSVRATRRALGISTDASQRYERGVDPEGMERALRRVLEVLLATAGGSLEPAVADAGPSPWERQTLSLRLARIERVLGVPFTEDAVRALLVPLGFEIAETREGSATPGAEATLEVAVPGYRSYDVKREIDLIEEIARAHGFDSFPADLGPFRPGTVPDHPLFQLEDELRGMLSEHGLHEAQTPAFVPETDGEVPLQNPISREEAFLRRTLLPSLVRRVERNFARGDGDVRLFELGTSFRAGDAADGLPSEAPHLAVVLTGRRAPRHWSGDPGMIDLWDLKGLLEAVVLRLGVKARVEPGAPTGPDAPWLQPGEAFVVLDDDGSVLGWGGRVAPRVVDAPPWAAPLWGFEVALPQAGHPAHAPSYRPLPSFPSVERDLALLVPQSVSSAQVLRRIREGGGEHLDRVEIFDLYRGKGVPDGTRSLAFRLRFQSALRTLTDDEVDRAVGALTDGLREDMDVQVRG